MLTQGVHGTICVSDLSRKTAVRPMAAAMPAGTPLHVGAELHRAGWKGDCDDRTVDIDQCSCSMPDR